MKQLTLAVAGISGCIGTTMAAGLAALQHGAEPLGLLTELPWRTRSGRAASLADRLAPAPLSNLSLMGWGVDTPTLPESRPEKGILPPELLQTVATELRQVIPLPPVSSRRAEAVQRAREHFRMLRSRGHDIVLIDVLPAVETPVQSSIHRDLAAFERG